MGDPGPHALGREELSSSFQQPVHQVLSFRQSGGQAAIPFGAIHCHCHLLLVLLLVLLVLLLLLLWGLGLGLGLGLQLQLQLQLLRLKCGDGVQLGQREAEQRAKELGDNSLHNLTTTTTTKNGKVRAVDRAQKTHLHALHSRSHSNRGGKFAFLCAATTNK